MSKTTVVALAVLSLPLAAAPGASVAVPEGAHPAVQFGARELRGVLEAKGCSALRVAFSERNDLKAPPESFEISAPDSNTIRVQGSDASGAMYGALELAERIAWVPDCQAAGRIQTIRKSPFLAIRGINTFLTAQGLDDPGSWFWSDDYWHSLLDQLARTRHNFLDLHGPFDLTLGWPNGFSYFVWLPDFAEVGVGREQAARNLARFRRILRMAADRGVRVGYMNYTAAAPIGPWKPGRFWLDARFIPRPQPRYLAASRLEQYNREASLAFLKALPELWMFGFRVGESGQPEDFYARTYLEALKSLPASLNVYARTWLADPAKMREIAASMKQRFYIQPKYNGEQLGLPYQAVTGGRQYPPSGSYEDYTNRPRNFDLIWQIRAHGTHRVFHWGWPEYARRTARTCKFGDGAGFSMEPMNAYCPEDDYLHNNPRTDHRFYRWKHQQEWFWYLVWGRTAYDPEVSDRVWLAEFERRFGPRAGPPTYRALVESSKIVPLIYSYHNQGLDHQHMAPEFETGDHALGVPGGIWQGARLVPRRGSSEDFLRVGVLDRTALADPATYVDHRLKDQPDGRMGPFEAAAYLESAAASSERAIAEAARLQPSSPKEFECILMDIQAVAALGRYYLNRILSATHQEFYRRTYHHPELTSAYQHLEQAVEHWDRLSDITEKHFAYVPEIIRMRVYKFRWREEGRSLGLVLDDLNRLETEFPRLESTFRARGIIGHVAPWKARPNQPLRVTATSAPDVKLHLSYRKPGELGYRAIPLAYRNETERTWVGEIPAEAVVPGVLEYYLEAYGGPVTGYGGTLQQRPPYRVRVTEDDAKPVITHTPPAGGTRSPSLRLTARVTDNARIASVRLYYKRMPAWHEWVPTDMQSLGGGSYSAEVPLTPEGILYYFEAIDENGNGANYPDFLERTPYFVIDSWDPAAR